MDPESSSIDICETRASGERKTLPFDASLPGWKRAGNILPVLSLPPGKSNPCGLRGWSNERLWLLASSRLGEGGPQCSCKNIKSFSERRTLRLWEEVTEVTQESVGRIRNRLQVSLSSDKAACSALMMLERGSTDNVVVKSIQENCSPESGPCFPPSTQAHLKVLSSSGHC